MMISSTACADALRFVVMLTAGAIEAIAAHSSWSAGTSKRLAELVVRHRHQSYKKLRRRR